MIDFIGKVQFFFSKQAPMLVHNLTIENLTEEAIDKVCSSDPELEKLKETMNGFRIGMIHPDLKYQLYDKLIAEKIEVPEQTGGITLENLLEAFDEADITKQTTNQPYMKMAEEILIDLYLDEK